MRSLFVDRYKGFFEAIGFSEERSKPDSETETIGNDCLLGQIASFMDNLNLSYNEVVEVIPYRNLIIMQKDKLRVCYGEKMNDVTEKDMDIKFD